MKIQRQSKTIYRIILVGLVIYVSQWNTRIASAEVNSNHICDVITSFHQDNELITVAPINLNSSGANSDRFMQLFIKKREKIASDLLWNEANAKMARSKNKHDFLESANVYYYLIKMGIKNGELFYNLGTALLLARQYDKALSAFVRAERYHGLTWEIKQNIRCTLAGQTRTWEEWHGTWHRYVFFWHYRLGLRVRVFIVICSILIIAIGLCLRIFFIKYRYGIAFIILGTFLAGAFIPSVSATVILEVSNTPSILLNNSY